MRRKRTTLSWYLSFPSETDHGKARCKNDLGFEELAYFWTSHADYFRLLSQRRRSWWQCREGVSSETGRPELHPCSTGVSQQVFCWKYMSSFTYEDGQRFRSALSFLHIGKMQSWSELGICQTSVRQLVVKSLSLVDCTEQGWTLPSLTAWLQGGSSSPDT